MEGSSRGYDETFEGSDSLESVAVTPYNEGMNVLSGGGVATAMRSVTVGPVR
jgi:hypothetical protein